MTNGTASRIGPVFGMLAMVATAQGCSDPVVGDWFGDGVVAGFRNRMTLSGGGDGEARMYFLYYDDVYKADFLVVWQNETAYKYDIEMRCDRDDCWELDFQMRCTRSGKRMGCAGDGMWVAYDLGWQQEEEEDD